MIFGPRYPVLKRVIVNTKTGKAFRGVLWERRGEYLVLREAELLAAGGRSERREVVSVDGDVLIDRSNVDFVQVVG